MSQCQQLLEQARQVMELEAEAIRSAASRIGQPFEKAVELMLAIDGRVIVAGMGKSGQVARKIAATLSSLGTPSAFMHPAEALHGDLGMIRPQDLVLMLSNSGETDELLRLLWFLEAQGNPSIVITGSIQSTLGRHCDVALDGSVAREACNHNLAPTCSTAVAMALGDALAVTLSSQRQFQASDFVRFHPGGSLGRRWVCTVSEVMRRQPLPCCGEAMPLRDLIPLMTGGRLGAAFVLRDEALVGIVTDGDLRRGLEQEVDLNRQTWEFMSRSPLQITSTQKVSSAIEIMQKAKVGILAVVDNEALIGAIQLYDCE
jgi:arabinose-5-phosphate isomerase